MTLPKKFTNALDFLLGSHGIENGFHGGLHLPPHKSQSTDKPAIVDELVSQYRLSLRQRDGSWLEPCVKKGEAVLGGQILAYPATNAGLILHAPTSGTIHAIAPYPDIHHSGEPALCIIIDADGKDQFLPPLTPLDEKAPVNALRQRIAECGIAGLGGAGFPTARKLNTHASTLVVNAAECEPYITCDDMQLREHSRAIVRGADIVSYIVGAERVIFGIEDDKPQAIEHLKTAIANRKNMQLKVVATKYPSGNSRQLFELLLGIRVPGNVHASDYGLICHNSATIKAVHDAVILGKPLIERYLTITGEGITHPHNRIVRLGTPIAGLIHLAGGQKANTHLLIGGPMMGEMQNDNTAGINKTTNCLLFLPNRVEKETMDCIRCAHCANACPMNLLPQQLYWYSRNINESRLQQYRLFDCIECGICASVCPSNIPLVQYYRRSKSDIKHKQHEKANAERSKQRYEARNARLKRETEERQAKMNAKRTILQESIKARQKTDEQIRGNFDPTNGKRTKSDKPIATESNKISAIEAAKARAAAKRAERLAQNQQKTDFEQEPQTSQTKHGSHERKIAQAHTKAKSNRAEREKNKDKE